VKREAEEVGAMTRNLGCVRLSGVGLVGFVPLSG
jgi:hypothetical protein